MLDIAISFDTTGSMSPAYVESRRRIKELCTRLFGEISGLRVAVIAHGDYCDKNSSYVTATCPFTTNPEDVNNFMQRTGNTGGGDGDECYELVLHEARALDWRQSKRAFLMLGDAEPHAVGYRWGDVTNNLDWRVEAKALYDFGVIVYAVQALGNIRTEREFWRPLAAIGGGAHLPLQQMNAINDLIEAVVYHQANRLQEFTDQRQSTGTLNRGLADIIRRLKSDVLMGEAYLGRTDGLEPVSPYRFQILHVDERIGIREFVVNTGATYKAGRGFYEFTKAENIQDHKEVVLVEKSTGDMFSGKQARQLLGLPESGTIRIRPAHLADYDVFVQSTSYSRILLPGTKFLYEAV